MRAGPSTRQRRRRGLRFEDHAFVDVRHVQIQTDGRDQELRAFSRRVQDPQALGIAQEQIGMDAVLLDQQMGLQ